MKNSKQNSNEGSVNSILPYLIVFALCLLLFVIYIYDTYPEDVFLGAVYFMVASIKVVALEAPGIDFPFTIPFFIGLIVYASMITPIVRNMYDGSPALISLFQLCFLMLVTSVIGLHFLNAWADNQLLTKTNAVLITIITYVLLRLCISYWYYKYPISSVITTKESSSLQVIPVAAGLVSRSVLPNESKHKQLVLLGLILTFFLGIYSYINTPSSLDHDKIMKEQISREPAAGTKLFNKEERNGIQTRDFNISGLTRGVSTRMLIWDFNSEDHDIVQILVDGKIIQDSFVLTNTPVAFTVPVPGVITIKGTQDQGGGLTYAVKFPQTRFTCFNIVAVNGVNTYTLLPKL
ncbi:hypothetical protein OB236_36170 [Paenibacillus sp. WQ 127069]|uniref:Uncharacterized protein n=1 Tax=Paenibacillus baimaensis TaxID=2982185 RepID=A0ABT2UU74_9BACL|nr:hypothetical protein [Paenibacillus sp. WQ 127069]MCU6797576.1 hypothetical protein [Paenibacillus sp. WQ 127069]